MLIPVPGSTCLKLLVPQRVSKPTPIQDPPLPQDVQQRIRGLLTSAFAAAYGHRECGTLRTTHYDTAVIRYLRAYRRSHKDTALFQPQTIHIRHRSQRIDVVGTASALKEDRHLGYVALFGQTEHGDPIVRMRSFRIL